MLARIAPVALAVSLSLALDAPAARAQGVPDHMQCYRVTDKTLRSLRGIVDLDAPSTGLAPGCKLGKAKLYCVPAEQSVQPGTLKDGPRPVSALPYHGPPAETDRVCYRVTCDRAAGTVPDQVVTDAFGTHDLRKLKTELVCKPATGGTLPPPKSGFQIKTPELDVPPFADIAQCYYFRTTNAVTVPVGRFTSEMGPLTKEVIFLTTTAGGGVPYERHPPGTVTAVDCDVLPDPGTVASRVVYAADTPTAEMRLPADDGGGNPVAIEIAANSAGYLLLHNVNPGTELAKTRVTINAEAVESPVYVTASTFATFDSTIAIPPMTNGYGKTRSCTVPLGAHFFRLTTHTHKRAVRSAIYDGADIAFETFDWEHAGAREVLEPPFLSFASGKLTYACTYDNPLAFTVRTGDSFQSDEQCVAIGYFFPATEPVWCYNGFIP